MRQDYHINVGDVLEACDCKFVALLASVAQARASGNVFCTKRVLVEVSKVVEAMGLEARTVPTTY